MCLSHLHLRNVESQLCALQTKSFCYLISFCSNWHWWFPQRHLHLALQDISVFTSMLCSANDTSNNLFSKHRMWNLKAKKGFPSISTSVCEHALWYLIGRQQFLPGGSWYITMELLSSLDIAMYMATELGPGNILGQTQADFPILFTQDFSTQHSLID